MLECDLAELVFARIVLDLGRVVLGGSKFVGVNPVLFGRASKHVAGRKFT